MDKNQIKFYMNKIIWLKTIMMMQIFKIICNNNYSNNKIYNNRMNNSNNIKNILYSQKKDNKN